MPSMHVWPKQRQWNGWIHTSSLKASPRFWGKAIAYQENIKKINRLLRVIPLISRKKTFREDQIMYTTGSLICSSVMGKQPTRVLTRASSGLSRGLWSFLNVLALPLHHPIMLVPVILKASRRKGTCLSVKTGLASDIEETERKAELNILSLFMEDPPCKAPNCNWGEKDRCSAHSPEISFLGDSRSWRVDYINHHGYQYVHQISLLWIQFYSRGICLLHKWMLFTQCKHGVYS